MFTPSPLRRTYAAALRDLRSSKSAVRAAAAQDLLGVGTTDAREAADALVPLLADAEGSVRAAAVTTLGGLDARHLLDAIAARLDDADSTVRQMAAVALSDLGGDRALAALRTALAHAQHDVRYQALLGVVRASPAEGFDTALGLLDDDDPWIAAEAAEQLGYLLDGGPDGSFTPDDEARARAVTSLRRACEDGSAERPRLRALASIARVRGRDLDALAAVAEIALGRATVPGADGSELRLDAIDALGAVRAETTARETLERLARSVLPTPARTHARMALGKT